MRFLTLLLILLWASAATGQFCASQAGMNPISAIPTCGTSVFTQTVIAPCSGPTITSASCTSLTSSNSFWYKFHCYQAGSLGLGFVITPVSPNSDYDWIMFDVTGLPDPNLALTQQSTQVSVNLCGFFGATGASSIGTSSVNCEGNTNLWNSLVPMQAGHDYLLMVTNWSFSTTNLGYNLNFGGGDAVITDTAIPRINSLSPVNCNGSQFKIVFSRDIRCASVTATGSELVIMPGNIPVTGIVSGCALGNNSITELTFNLQNPLPGGNYNLVINNGSDGNTYMDACDASIPAGTQIPFSVPTQAQPVVSNITYNGCAPTVLNVSLSKPILCSSITATGSEFLVTPGNHPISSVQFTCTGASSYTSSLQVVLQNPLPHGSYQLTISNGTDGNTLIDTCSMSVVNPYNFPFTITQTTTAPAIQSVTFNECQPDQVILNFDKPFNCSSVTLNGDEFSITPGTWPLAAITTNCVNLMATQVILTLQNNLPAGNFNVNINNGTDGNTLADSCYAFVAAGYTKPFVTTQAPLPVFDSVTFNKCDPSFIKVYYNRPIKCSSISANGSDFTITGPSPVSITSATTNTTCAQGFTNWVLLQLSQPISVVGNYLLHNGTGADGNGIIDTCNATQSNTETLAFNVLVKPDATFISQVRWGCITDTITLSHAGGDAINAWTWNFSDGTSATTQNASHQFPVSTVTAGIELIVSNGLCSDTAAITVPLNNAFNAAIGQAIDTTCLGKPVTFSDASTGNNLQFHWNFGDNTTFNGQAPPPHSFPGNNTYTVTLTCTNDHGCTDTAMETIYATALPVISFSGLNNKYCTREKVSLVSNLQGNIDSYSWATGNGSTFQNTPTASFSYPLQNDYTITITANDRFCGTTTYSETTTVYQVPVVYLGKDTMLCPQMKIQLGMPHNPDLLYTWSTGASASQIMTGLASNTYILSVDNHGCIGEGKIFVEMLDGCLIRVPGAFTPNNDSKNDILKAHNAFLATNFSLSVYNRFGQKVFATTNPLEGWNGKFKGQDESPGTYVWQLSYTDPWTHQPVFQKGTSILIR